jgi:predicted secreted protein
MAITSIISVYFIVWWLVLFITLPLGVRTAEEVGEEREAGHAASAPMKPMLVRKALATTVISAVLVGGFFTLAEFGVIDIRALLLGK